MPNLRVRFTLLTEGHGSVLVDRLGHDPARFFCSRDVAEDVRDALNEQWRARFEPCPLQLPAVPINEVPRGEYTVPALTRIRVGCC
jgi:hypothetical protein